MADKRDVAEQRRLESPSGKDKDESNMKEKPAPVDRKKVCPFLLRVFYNVGRHYRMEEYSRGRVPMNELQIYTWKDATLKELMALIKEVNSDSRRRGTLFEFGIVYPDKRGGYRLRDIGKTIAGQKTEGDQITLGNQFQIGDYLDIALVPPRMRRGRPY